MRIVNGISSSNPTTSHENNDAGPPPEEEEEEKVSRTTARPPWARLFEEHGLAEFVDKVEEATGAKTTDDLKILAGDERMADEAVRSMGMKMIPRSKFKALLKTFAVAVAVNDDDANENESEANTNANVDDGNSPAVADDKKTSSATNAATTTTNVSVPAEYVAVCVDRSYSMGSPFEEKEGWGENAGKTLARRSRMDAVKQVFYAFRDRTETLLKNDPNRGIGERHHHHHELGLLSFDERVEVHLGCTPSLDAFEEIIDDVEHRGSTAIYSAVKAAAEEILRPAYEAWKEDNDGDDGRRPDLRVLCLTDGENNRGVGPEEALRAVNAIGAVVDAVVVGDNPDRDLRRIVAATGGECYRIRTLGEGFQLMEGEGVVSLKARWAENKEDDDDDDDDGPAVVHRKIISDLSTVAARKITAAGEANGYAVSSRRKRLADVGKNDRVVSLRSKATKAKLSTNDAAGSDNASVGCVKRIVKELRRVAENDASVWTNGGDDDDDDHDDEPAGRGVHIFPNEADLTDVRVLMEGPPSSPFADGVFLLRVGLPRDYPFRPPAIAFVTPVYHPNVSADNGGVCMKLLQDAWRPDATVPRVLAEVRRLLAEPDADNALRQEIAEEVLAYRAHGESTADGRRYVDRARACTRREAGRSVADFTRSWNLTEESEDEDDV